MKLTPQQKIKDKRLKATYGISWYEYCQILKFQGNTCAICKQPPKRYNLSVDHRHVLKDKKHRGLECRSRCRGLLCFNCNKAIAKFRDDPERLRRAADYLQDPPAQHVLKKRKK